MATVVVVDDSPFSSNGDLAPNRFSAQMAAVEIVRTLCEEMGERRGQHGGEAEEHRVGAIGGFSGRCYFQIGAAADAQAPSAQDTKWNSSSSAGRRVSGAQEVLETSEWIDVALRRARLMLKSYTRNSNCPSRVLLFLCSPVDPDAGAAALPATKALRSDGIFLDVVTFGDAQAIPVPGAIVSAQTQPLLHAMYDGSDARLSGGMWRISTLFREMDVAASQRPAAVLARQKNPKLYLAAAPPEWRSAVLRMARPMKVKATAAAGHGSGPGTSTDAVADALRGIRQSRQSMGSMAGCRPIAMNELKAKVVRELTLMRPRVVKLEKEALTAIQRKTEGKDKEHQMFGIVDGKLVGIELERARIGAPIINATRAASHLLRSGVVLTATECVTAPIPQTTTGVHGRNTLAVRVQQLVPKKAGFPIPRVLKGGELGELSALRATPEEGAHSDSIGFVIFRPFASMLPTDVMAILPCGSGFAKVVGCREGNAICALQISCRPSISKGYTLVSGRRTAIFFFQVLSPGGDSSGASVEDSRRVCDDLNQILQRRARPISVGGDFSYLSDALLPRDCADVWTVGHGERGSCGGVGTDSDQFWEGTPPVRGDEGHRASSSAGGVGSLTVRSIESVLVECMEGTDLSSDVQALWSISSPDQAGRIHGQGLVAVRHREAKEEDEGVDDEEADRDVPGDMAECVCSDSEIKDARRLGWLCASSVAEKQWACLVTYKLHAIEKKISLDPTVLRMQEVDAAAETMNAPEIAAAIEMRDLPASGEELEESALSEVRPLAEAMESPVGAPTSALPACSKIVASDFGSSRSADRGSSVPSDRPHTNSDTVGEGDSDQINSPAPLREDRPGAISFQALQKLLRDT